MRILMLNYEFPPIGGGAAPVSKDLATELVKMGNTVTVVTMGYKDLPAEEIIGGVLVYRVKCIRKEVCVCHPWEQFSYIFSARLFLGKLLKQESFDIVHTHFIIPTGVLSYWIKRKYSISYVITAHGSDVMGYNQKRFKLLHKLLLGPWKKIVKAADAVVSPSMYLEELICKILPEMKINIIPNGVDTELFRPLQKKKQILVMCRLQETKGVQTVIRAFAQSVQLEQWKLLIVGDGPYMPALKRTVKELDREDRIEFIGWVKNKSPEHLRLFGESAIYISASRFENSPVSVLEALSSECLVLLSDIPPHRLLENRETHLFSVNNENELAFKMKKMIEDYNNGNPIMGNRPISLKKVAERYNQLYQSVLRGEK